MTIRTRPSLRQILSGLLEQARTRPAQSVSFNLARGLGLHLLVDIAGHLHLGISRFTEEPSQNAPPSQLEWETVCLAIDLPVLTPREEERAGRHYLIAEFELPEQEKLL